MSDKNFKIGDPVRYKGGIGPNMVIIAIGRRGFGERDQISSVTLKYFDEFLQEFKDETIYNTDVIEIVE